MMEKATITFCAGSRTCTGKHVRFPAGRCIFVHSHRATGDGRNIQGHVGDSAKVCIRDGS